METRAAADDAARGARRVARNSGHGHAPAGDARAALVPHAALLAEVEKQLNVCLLGPRDAGKAHLAPMLAIIAASNLPRRHPGWLTRLLGVHRLTAASQCVLN